MPRLSFVLLESSITLLPPRFYNSPEARSFERKFGKKPHEQVLDISFHYRVVEELRNPKLGRPDIVHLTLLSLFSLPRELIGEIYVHTVDNKLIWVSKDIRLPKNYFRFLGLVSQLLREGKVPPRGEPLMQVVEKTLAEVVDGKLVLLDEKGRKVKLREVCEFADGMFLGIGAFPHGEFSEEIVRMAKDRISILSGKPMEAYQVVCLISSACTSSFGLD